MYEELRKRFEAVHKEYLEFERIEKPANRHRDLCAFMMLAKLAPRGDTVLAGAEHDRVVFLADLAALHANATDADIVDLVRCGVCFDGDYGNRLHMHA